MTRKKSDVGWRSAIWETPLHLFISSGIAACHSTLQARKLPTNMMHWWRQYLVWSLVSSSLLVRQGLLVYAVCGLLRLSMQDAGCRSRRPVPSLDSSSHPLQHAYKAFMSLSHQRVQAYLDGLGVVHAASHSGPLRLRNDCSYCIRLVRPCLLKKIMNNMLFWH